MPTFVYELFETMQSSVTRSRTSITKSLPASFKLSIFTLSSESYIKIHCFPYSIKLVLAIASLVCFAFCLIYSGRILHVLEFNNANVWHMSNLYNQNIGMLLVLKVLVYIGSIITTFAVLMFVNLPKSICAYGSKTLAYYVIQGMFAHILSTYLQVNFYQALFLCVCILILTTVLLRFVDSKFITNPFSTLLKWKY